jgi:hypothetical protein
MDWSSFLELLICYILNLYIFPFFRYHGLNGSSIFMYVTIFFPIV